MKRKEIVASIHFQNGSEILRGLLESQMPGRTRGLRNEGVEKRRWVQWRENKWVNNHG